MATFLFMPESAYGPTNNCIGIGDILRRNGHRVVFAAEASWAGRLEPLGFVEDLVDLAPPPPPDAAGRRGQAAGQFWTDFIRDTKPVFRTSTFDQLSGFMQPTWQALIDGAMYCEPQLKEIIDRQRPDVIVEDNVNCFPALDHGRRAVRAHRQLPTAGDERGRHPPDLQRSTRRRSQRMGCVSCRVRPHSPTDLAGIRRVGAVVRRPPSGRPRVRPREH